MYLRRLHVSELPRYRVEASTRLLQVPEGELPGVVRPATSRAWHDIQGVTIQASHGACRGRAAEGCRGTLSPPRPGPGWA